MSPPVDTRPATNGSCADRGAAVVELLVASVLVLMVLAAAATFVLDQLAAAASQPEAADLQQRARLAGDLVTDGLASAGAWSDHGGPRMPPSCCLPVVQPRRFGWRQADPPGVARADVVTLVRARADGAAVDVGQLSGGLLTLQPGNACPVSRPACGLRPGEHVVVFDPTGRHDFLVVGGVAGMAAVVSARQASAPATYGSGATAAAVETLTYAFDPSRRQLRLYDGYQSDVPILDDVVALRFEYFGDAGAPARGRTGAETCWFDGTGNAKYGRAETPPGAPIVPLALPEFEDGPWCGVGDNRFDADLLRIRLVRAVIRLQAGAATARGRTLDFLEPGRAATASRLVPDVEVTIDAAPRVSNGG